jgi:hypothetical protein
MKKRKIKGRCYIKGKQRGYLRRMRQKERENIEMDRYMRNVANFDGEEHCTKLVEKLLSEMREKQGDRPTERRPVIQKPEENPAVWLIKEYGYSSIWTF